MRKTPNIAKQIIQVLGLASCLIISGSSNAQTLGQSGAQTTLSHELMLIVIGALLGGFLGPLLTIVDGWIGISPGAKQQKANYAVQREIAESLRTLITLQAQTCNTDSARHSLFETADF